MTYLWEYFKEGEKMKNVEKIKPTGLFTNYIYKAIPLAFDESMSYYETLCGLLSYLKDTVVPALNNNADAIIEVQSLITQLQDYVDNYFKNLDVQQEINNKLDTMAQDGTLTEIIAQYLNLAGIIAFNTVANLKATENIVNGSFTKTYGKLTYNDGYGAFYKIRTLVNTDVIDEDKLIALTNYPTLVAEKMPDARLDKLESKDYIVFIGDSWTTEYPTGTDMWYLKVARRLGLTPKVYGDGGSGFIHIGAQGTFNTQVTKALAEIDDINKVKIVAVTGGINDYHDDSVTESDLRNAVTTCLNRIKDNFPNAEIVFTPLQMSYEQMTDRAFLIYNALKSGAMPSSATILTGCYNWIKTFPQTFGYYDTHMNQTGNEIFATPWLSSYHGKGYNHTHIYQPYPISGITSLNSQAHVCGSKVSIYSQLQVASGTTFTAGNNKIITYSNNVVGLPLYSLSARAITCWVNLTTSNGSIFKCIPAYLSVKPYVGTENNQGSLEITLHFDDAVSVTNNSSYIYITCDIDTALTES